MKDFFNNWTTYTTNIDIYIYAHIYYKAQIEPVFVYHLKVFNLTSRVTVREQHGDHIGDHILKNLTKKKKKIRDQRTHVLPIFFAGGPPLVRTVVQQRRHVGEVELCPALGVETTRRVPLVVACAPGKHGVERVEEIVERPRDNHVVVDTHDGGDYHHPVADSCKR